MIRAHLFTNLQADLFYKQIPDFAHQIDGVDFSIGMEIPDDIDVLILYGRASYSIPTHLPKDRTIFHAAEPDVIHPYATRFLNQFGLVFTTSDKALDTKVIRGNYCALPFVGIRFGEKLEPTNIHDFTGLPCPTDKDDRISVVTSNKTGTEFHRQRLAFLEVLKERIPERLVIYGHGFRPIEDKADALLPHKYHVSLENGRGQYTWTEKLSDPLLCWAYPFYFGCENVHEDLPGDAFEYIDITDPDTAIAQMIDAVDSGRWAQRVDAIAKARLKVIEDFNLMRLLARMARTQAAVPLPDHMPPRLIRSERSFPPEEPGQRGSRLEAAVRSALLAVDPKIELRLSNALKRRADRRQARKRARAAGGNGSG